MAPFYLIWQQNGIVYTGYESPNYINNNITFAINNPGNLSETQTVSVSSSAQINQTFNTLQNVKIYLTGDPISLQIVQQLWPILGNGYIPPKTELNGGLEISFDGGNTYTLFSPTVGNQSDPSTWIVLPGLSIGINGQDGILGAFDTATFVLRYSIPPGAVEYQKFNIGLALDFDII